MAKILKVRRLVSPNPQQAAKSAVTITVEQSHARQIHELPKEQLTVAINAIRDGVKNQIIAAFFADQGWLDVTEKTFCQYLNAFKRVYAASLVDEDDNTLNGIPGLDKRQPGIDEEAQLEQLARLMSIRLRRGVNFELQTGFVNQHLHKDVLAANTVLETLAKIRGKTTSVGRPSANGTHVVGNEAQEQLRKADVNEGTQDKLSGLVASLIPLIEKKVNVGKA